jgi:hypothetical protein
MAKHFVGMSGLSGYLPNFVGAFDTKGAAVDTMAELHEFGSVRKRELSRDGYTSLDNEKHGAEYAELIECNCSVPHIHNMD